MDRDQDWIAQRAGFKNKHDVQIARLAVQEQAVADHDSLEGLSTVLKTRYNPFQEQPVIESILGQLCEDEAVWDHVVDE